MKIFRHCVHPEECHCCQNKVTIGLNHYRFNLSVADMGLNIESLLVFKWVGTNREGAHYCIWKMSVQDI